MDDIAALEQEIEQLNSLLKKAKDSLETLNNFGKSLSVDAAQERAKNQDAGNGLFGALFGAKYRSAVRAGARASNAAISKEVAKKRAKILDNKLLLNSHIKEIKEQLADKKRLLKELKQLKGKKPSGQVIDLLHKLKEAHAAGILSDAEYEEKRKKFIDQL